MGLGKWKCLMKTFTMYQFKYCPLVWMMHSTKLNNHINKIHKRVLRLTYNDNHFTFGEIPGKENSMTVHYKNF